MMKPNKFAVNHAVHIPVVLFGNLAVFSPE